MKLLNWLLYEVHRWLGIALAIFMFVWFLTGLVIMYSTPTTQTRSQQLAHAETLSPESGWLSLGEIWASSGEQRRIALAARKAKLKPAGDTSHNQEHAKPAKASDTVNIADARLIRSNGQPFWLLEDDQGQRFAFSATDGQLHETSADEALQIAKHWFQFGDSEPVEQAHYLDLQENPIILRNQDALKPFHHISVGDDGKEVLISAITGEVLHASTRTERAFYWAGNWLHLFKPLEALGLGQIRHDVQMWSGLLASIAALTGLIIGWIRWRPGFNGGRTYSQGRTQPYREFWYKWHFWTGFIGGSVALCWALSGFIDTNPGKLFSAANYTKEELKRYLGEGLPEAMANWRPTALDDAAKNYDVVELGWRRLGKESMLLAFSRDGQRIALSLIDGLAQFSQTELLAAVNRVGGADKAVVESKTLLTEYDSYYYPRHHQTLVEKPLPVLLVKMADAAGSRFYLDPQDGRLLSKLDNSRLVYRWLYSGLHHWDFGWLNFRPIWDVWMLTWVGFGLVLATSSLFIGWKRLRKTFMPKRKAARRNQPTDFQGQLLPEQTVD